MFKSDKQYKDSRYENIIKLINNFDAKLLDVGCGHGYLEHKLSEYNFDITGFDISKEYILQAKENFPNSNYFVGDACKEFVFDDDEFDIVVCHGVIEHVENPSNVVKECLRVSRECCIIGAPNAWHFDLYFNTQKYSLSESVFQYFSPNVLRGLIRKFGGIVDYINLSALIPPFKFIITKSHKSLIK